VKRPLSLAAGAVVALAFAVPSAGPRAQTATPAPPASAQAPTSVTAPDLAFILKAAQGGAEEVALGNMATEKADNAKVKSFARQMVEDHTRANKDLAALARSRGLGVPDAPDQAGQTVSAALADRSGPEFDREYVAQQVAAHEATLAQFRFAAENAADPDLKAFARRYEPAIAHHLKLAQGLMGTALGHTATLARKGAPVAPAAPAQ
jgi:putative membrane protein